jgi:hypothetical protein
LARSTLDRRWLIGGIVATALVLAVGGIALLTPQSHSDSTAATESPAATPAAAQLSDPCALLSTKGQLVIGAHHLAASMPDTIAGASECVWSDKQKVVGVSITTRAAQLVEALRETARLKRPGTVRGPFSIPNSPVTVVHGIGDMARQERPQQGTVRVEFLRGQCVVRLDNVNRDHKESDAANGLQTRALAAQIVRRLDATHACA